MWTNVNDLKFSHMLNKTIFFHGLYIKHCNLKELMGDINAYWKASFVALITQTAAFPVSLIYLLTVALPIIYPFFFNIGPVFFASKEPTPQETCSFDQPCVVQGW